MSKKSRAIKEQKIKDFEQKKLYHSHLALVENKTGFTVDENYNFKNSNNFFVKLGKGIFVWFINTFILGSILFFKYSLKVKGRKNIRKAKKVGCVSVSNHVFPFDGPTLYHVFFPHEIHIVALENSYSIPLLRHTLKFFDVYPLPTGVEGMKKFLRVIKSDLNNKATIHVMPEGSLWDNYDKVRPFLPGAFTFAVRNNAPILPVAFAFRDRGFFKKIFHIKQAGVTMLVGEMIYPNEELDRKASVDDLSKRAYDEIMKLKEDYYKKIEKPHSL